MYSAFNLVSESELLLADKELGLIAGENEGDIEDRNDQIHQLSHSENFKKYTNSYVVEKYVDKDMKEDQVHYITYNSFSIPISKAINENGVVKVGPNYLRYTHSKIIKFSDLKNKDLLLIHESLIPSVSYQGVQIEKIESREDLMGVRNGRINTNGSWSKSCATSGSNRVRILSYQDLFVKTASWTTWKGYYFRLRTHALRKRRGWWYDSYPAYHRHEINCGGSYAIGSWWDGSSNQPGGPQSCQNLYVDYSFNDVYFSDYTRVFERPQPLLGHEQCNLGPGRPWLLSNTPVDIRTSNFNGRIERRGNIVSCNANK